MDSIETFYQLAKKYCNDVSETEISNASAEHFIKMIMQLYLLALELPSSEPDSPDASFILTEPVRIRSGERFSTLYWEVFDPTVYEEPVCGNIIEDLSEIAADLQKGILEYERNKLENAAFEWRCAFDSHWGNHAVDVLRALHAIRGCGMK